MGLWARFPQVDLNCVTRRSLTVQPTGCSWGTLLKDGRNLLWLCLELSYVSSASPGCPATHLQSPPGAGRRAPLLRRLSAVGVRPRPPLSGLNPVASPSICPVSTTLGGGTFGAGLCGRCLGRSSRLAGLSRPLVALPRQAGTSSPRVQDSKQLPCPRTLSAPGHYKRWLVY